MSSIEEAAPVTPYQARLYGAVIHGYDRGRRRTERMVRVLWRSRRFWQQRSEAVLQRVQIAEALLDGAAFWDQYGWKSVRADLIRYALDPTTERPDDWEEVLRRVHEQFAA